MGFEDLDFGFSEYFAVVVVVLEEYNNSWSAIVHHDIRTCRKHFFENTIFNRRFQQITQKSSLWLKRSFWLDDTSCRPSSLMTHWCEDQTWNFCWCLSSNQLCLKQSWSTIDWEFPMTFAMGFFVFESSSITLSMYGPKCPVVQAVRNIFIVQHTSQCGVVGPFKMKMVHFDGPHVL